MTVFMEMVHIEKIRKISTKNDYLPLTTDLHEFGNKELIAIR